MDLDCLEWAASEQAAIQSPGTSDDDLGASLSKFLYDRGITPKALPDERVLVGVGVTVDRTQYPFRVNGVPVVRERGLWPH